MGESYGGRHLRVSIESTGRKRSPTRLTIMFLLQRMHPRHIWGSDSPRILGYPRLVQIQHYRDGSRSRSLRRDPAPVHLGADR
jgi:hypothetical protein